MAVSEMTHILTLRIDINLCLPICHGIINLLSLRKEEQPSKIYKSKVNSFVLIHTKLEMSFLFFLKETMY